MENNHYYDKILANLYKQCTRPRLDRLIKLSKEIWQTCDNTYGYVDEKIGMLDSVDTSKPDSIWYICNMFDPHNRKKLWALTVEHSDKQGYKKLRLIMYTVSVLEIITFKYLLDETGKTI